MPKNKRRSTSSTVSESPDPEALPSSQPQTTGDAATRGLAFVLMPFANSFSDVYKMAIKPSCEANGYRCERVDEQMFFANILSQIYDQIKHADLLVADMTGRNANVFYEVGYAHGLGKDVIFVTNNSDDIPFDLKHHSHITYNNSLYDLREKLTARIAAHLRQLDGEPSPTCDDLEFWINKQALKEDSIVKVPGGMSNYGAGLLLELQFGIGNPRPVGANLKDLSISLTCPPNVRLGTQAISNKLGRSTSTGPDGTVCIRDLYRCNVLPPRCREFFELDIWLEDKTLNLNKPYPITLTLEQTNVVRVIKFEIIFDPLYRLN
jgi:hypothetical protein